MEEKGLVAVIVSFLVAAILGIFTVIGILRIVKLIAGVFGWNKIGWVCDKTGGVVEGGVLLVAGKIKKMKNNSKEEEVSLEEADFDKVDIKSLLKELKS